ncbi:MAG: cytidylate kinase-like family protein [Pirellulales bacterium]|nr:cytidylate kinase-like family protein [Pirellulales bacterium]
MKEQTREEPKILAAAERQMQAWAMSQEIAHRTLHSHGPHRVSPQLGHYISISREAGAGGSELGAILGERLGWEVMDRNLLDQVAERYRLSKSMLELVDETTANWAFDILGTWIDPKLISHEKYLVHLGRVILNRARKGNVIFVGRGAQFLLPRDHGLAVRIIADEKHRIARIMRRENLDEATARRMMEELDRGRNEFVQQFFRRDLNDPHLYDLVIRVDRVGLPAAAELIVATYDRVVGEREKAEADR